MCGFPRLVARALAAGGPGFHRVKCIAQRDLVDVPGVRVLLDLRIDEEHHRHVGTLAGFQSLLGEAEALDLLEIFADLVGADVEHRLPGQRLRAQVLGAVENPGLRAGLDAHRGLFGLEAPRQAGMDVGVEPHADLTGNGARGTFGPLRRPIEAGQLAEHAVERHRGEGEADHRGDQDRHIERGPGVAVLNERGHQLIPVLAMVMKNIRMTNAPSSQAMIRARSRWRLRMTSSSWLTMPATGRRRAWRTMRTGTAPNSRTAVSRVPSRPARR